MKLTELLDMPMHTSVKVNSTGSALRVVGGWLYTISTYGHKAHSSTTTFVPEPKTLPEPFNIRSN